MASSNNPSQLEAATGQATPQSSPTESKLSEADLLADLKRVARQTTGSVSEEEYTARGAYGVTTFRRRFGSWNAAKEQAGLETRHRERISEDRLLADLRRVAETTEGPVSERTYSDVGEFGVTTFRRRFGSWSAAKRCAGLETERDESTIDDMADDVARVAADLDAGYVTPERYAEQGTYPLAALPTDEAFWDDLRDRVGLSITPLYHKVAFDAERDPE